MKILILTQYFPPETGAPQNRLYELAVRLKTNGADVSVLTAMPNYPQMQLHQKYRGKFYCYEEMDGLHVHRCWIYVSKSKRIFKRLLNYFSFVKTSFWIGWFILGKYDYLLCESPPLFLGITAYLLKKLKRAKLIFNVSDLWPESAEKLGLVTNRFLLKISTRLEEFLYRNTFLITGQTQGIVKNISDRFPDKKVYWLPNGVDIDYFNPDNIKSEWRLKNNFSENDFILLYAGIIGHAQGLEVILNCANILCNKKEIKFVLMGDGPEKGNLISLKNKMKLENVFFFESVLKKEIHTVLKSVDIAIIPLKKIDLFKGAIPSKIFEALAMKKPILLGVEGEAKELFIDEAHAGIAFEPENATYLANAVLNMIENIDQMKVYGSNGSEYVKRKFNRDIIAVNFFNLLKDNLTHD